MVSQIPFAQPDSRKKNREPTEAAPDGSFMTPSVVGTELIDLNGFVVTGIDQGNCVLAAT